MLHISCHTGVQPSMLLVDHLVNEMLLQNGPYSQPCGAWSVQIRSHQQCRVLAYSIYCIMVSVCDRRMQIAEVGTALATGLMQWTVGPLGPKALWRRHVVQNRITFDKVMTNIKRVTFIMRHKMDPCVIKRRMQRIALSNTLWRSNTIMLLHVIACKSSHDYK